MNVRAIIGKKKLHGKSVMSDESFCHKKMYKAESTL